MSLADLPLERPLVVGLGVTAQAVCQVLATAGHHVLVIDDHPTPHAASTAQLLGVELIASPSPDRIDDLVATATAVLPSPGVPDRHPVFAAARQRAVPVLSEFDLAQALDDRPLLAITGTDGKTTVVTLVTEMLAGSGVRAVAAGNTELPLVTAIADPEPELFVVEVSSFRLAHSAHFRPLVATWLNFAPDHLDAHTTLADYEQAKARIWSELPDTGTAVANADDAVVMRHVLEQNRTVTFSLDADTGADYRIEAGSLVGPAGALAHVEDLTRRLPHDLANDLAAAATALAGGATVDGVRNTIQGFAGLPHRVHGFGEAGGIRWVDDSKATVPHATLAAVAGCATESGPGSVVLLAGGRNKGLDLSVLAAAAPHLRAVVAIGEAAPEVADAFAGLVPVSTATSMADAVDRAAAEARPGDVVLLSPGCASFDWYTSYAERGDDFVATARARIAGLAPGEAS